MRNKMPLLKTKKFIELYKNDKFQKEAFDIYLARGKNVHKWSEEKKEKEIKEFNKDKKKFTKNKIPFDIYEYYYKRYYCENSFNSDINPLNEVHAFDHMSIDIHSKVLAECITDTRIGFDDEWVLIYKYWNEYTKIHYKDKPRQEPYLRLWNAMFQAKNNLKMVRKALLNMSYTEAEKGVPFRHRYKYAEIFALLPLLENKSEMIECLRKVFRLWNSDAQEGMMYALFKLEYTDKENWNMLKDGLRYWNKHDNYVMECDGTGMKEQMVQLFRIITMQRVKWWEDEEVNEIITSRFKYKDVCKMKTPFDK